MRIKHMILLVLSTICLHAAVAVAWPPPHLPPGLPPTTMPAKSEGEPAETIDSDAELTDQDYDEMTDLLVSMCEVAQAILTNEDGGTTAWMDAESGSALPVPGKNGPVDYVVWLISQTETELPGAAPYFESAAARYVPWDGPEEIWDCALDGHWDALTSREINTWLMANQPAFDDYWSAQPYEYRGVVELDPDDDRLLHACCLTVSKCKKIAKALLMKARVLQLHGDTTGALELLCNQIAIGGKLAHGPTCIDPLVGIAIQGTACDQILDLLAETSDEEIDCAWLAAQAEATFLDPGDLIRSFRFEQAITLDLIQGLYHFDQETKSYRLREDYLSIWHEIFGFDDEQEEEFFSRALESQTFSYLVSHTNMRFHVMTQSIRNPFVDAYLILRFEEQEVGREGYRLRNPILCYCLPSISRIYEVFTRGNAHRTATRLIINLRAYRQKQDEYPVSLDAAFDREMTIDPFSGEPFIYHRDGDDFVLYSLGRNVKYDDGKRDRRGEDGDIYFWPRSEP